MITADTLLDRLIFMAIGCFFGLILGWISRTMSYAKEARNDAHITMERAEQIINELKDESGKVSVQSIALALVVITVAFSAIISGYNANVVADTQEESRASQKCTEHVLSDVIRTLNDRIVYADDVGLADRRQSQAYLKIVRMSIEAALDGPERSVLYARYEKKLEEYLKSVQKLQQSRVKYPYPDTQDYRKCLKDAEKATDKD